jgi:hypothetical protein
LQFATGSLTDKVLDVGVGVAAGVGSTGLKTGFGDGFGAALTATPLFQTSFVPDLMQVNFFPADVDVAPAFVHFAPALAVANAGAEMREAARIRATNRRVCFTAIRYQAAIPI